MPLNDDEPDVEGYARTAARLAGLVIDDSWWPAVVRHLGVLLERAASLETVPLPADPGPVFRPGPAPEAGPSALSGPPGERG